MHDATTLFMRTFLIGVAVAAPVGAMGALCIQRVLSEGWRAGLSTGAGIATADGIYAAVAAFGVAAVSSAFVALQVPLRLAGGAVLVYLGLRSLMHSMRRTPDCDGELTTPARATSIALSYGSHYASAVALTLTNPTTIMAFGAVFTSAGLSAAKGVLSAAIATLGVASGSLTWWVALTAVVTLVRRSSTERLALWVTRVSGVVIAAFGVAAIFSVAL